jgi:hypothetical protein
MRAGDVSILGALLRGNYKLLGRKINWGFACSPASMKLHSLCGLGRSRKVPEGRSRIARGFNAGFIGSHTRVPKGGLILLSKGNPWKRNSAVPPGLISTPYLDPALKRRAIHTRSLRDSRFHAMLFTQGTALGLGLVRGLVAWMAAAAAMVGFCASMAAHTLVIGTGDELVRLETAGEDRREVISTGAFPAVCFGPEGDLFALREDGALLRFDGESYNYVSTFVRSEELTGADDIAFAGDGRLVAARGNLVFVFQAGAAVPERVLNLGSSGVQRIAGLVVGMDGLISVSDPERGRVFRIDLSVASGNPVSLFSDRFGSPLGLAFAGGGGLLAADDGTVPALVRLEGDDRSLGGFFASDLPEGANLRGLSRVTVAPDGTIAVAGAGADGIFLFSPDLRFAGMVADPGAPIRTVAFAPRPAAAGRLFEDWREEHFSASEREDPAISGPTADPAGEGVPNLVRYVLGAGPRESLGDRRPVLAIERSGGEAYLEIGYVRARGLAGVMVELEVSSDLVEWRSAPDLPAVENLGETERLTYRLNGNAGGDERIFARLRVHLTE